MPRRLARNASGCLLVIALALPGTRSALAAVQLAPNFANEVLLSGLNMPTSLAFLPDGRVLLTEQKSSKVRLFVNGHLAVTDPVLVPPNVRADAYERGLLGIAVDPAWPARPFIYVYYSRMGGFCRLIRFKGIGDLADPLGENLIFSNSLTLIDNIPDLTEYHQAGCLRFGPDSMLYVSSGEDDRECPAADSTTLLGAILRLDVSRLPDAGGSSVPRALITPPDNPFAGADSNAALVWAYGLRNPWRFQIDPATGLIYSADVGEDVVEEVNEIARGDYLGWPWREGNVVIQRAACPEPGGVGSIAYKHPIVAMYRGQTLAAIISAGRYRPVPGAPANWPPEYWGHELYGEYYSGFLRRIQNVDGTWQPAVAIAGQPDTTNWATGLLSCVDFLTGPDGSLWWLRQYNDSQSGVTGSLQRIRWLGPTVGVEQGPRPATSLAVRPNPSASSSELSFLLPAQAYVRLELFDASGRLTRRLVDATLTAGLHRFQWDGRDTNGRSVAPGVYLARLERPGARELTRVLRLR